MQTEIWKDIPGWEGLYQVSNLGKVKSFKTSEKILQQNMRDDGRGRVFLTKAYFRKSFRTSRLVASAFHGLDLNDPKQLACHRDDNPGNDRADNIFVGTQKDNILDMHSKGRGATHNTPKKSVSQFSLDLEFIKKWESARSIERELGINHKHISLCCNEKRKTTGGFIFKFC